MVAPNPLSEQDLVAARAELAAGKPVTVWFTSAAVGVPAGGSAKVISVDEPAEGDFIQVRAAGSRDTMFCSPGELTRSRPARKRVQPAAGDPAPVVPRESAPRASVSARGSAPRVTASRVSAPPEAAPAETASQKAAPPKAAPPKAAPPKTAPPTAVSPRESTPVPAALPEEKAPEKVPERPRSGGGRSAARPAEVSVTLSATAEGEWTVEVMIGKKRTVRATPVQPAEVAKAARSLPTAVAEAIESSLAAARQRQAERVERLSAELEAAQLALRELSG